MLRRGRVAIVVFAALAVASCRQLVGIQDEPPTAGAVTPAGSADASGEGGGRCSAGGSACASCMASSCCPQLTACADDDAGSGCKTSLDCMLQCAAGDEACSAGCVQVLDRPLAEALACRAQSCATECGLSCGGILGVVAPGFIDGSPDCAGCAASKACTELTTCAATADCIRYAACRDRSCAPLDRSCVISCEYAVGPTPAGDAVLSALKGSCATECRLGSNFDCVGKGAWPLGELGTQATFSLRFYDDVTQQPMAGMLVRACPLADESCSNEWSHATTDATGFVSVSAPLSPQGNANAGVFQGYAEESGGGAYPTLTFLSPPLTGSLPGDASYTPYRATSFSAQDIALVAGMLPVSLDPTLGHVAALAFDCLLVPAPGVIFRISPPGQSLVVYSHGGAFAPQATTTDTTGAAAIVNVAPGPVTLSVRLAATRELVAQQPAFVRAQTISSIVTAPLP